ncbi:MAG: signal peptidase I [candidate division Zixibacteria bacterium]|nr:signal peptidase I [candidate division Zixibacteria bacterium]
MGRRNTNSQPDKRNNQHSVNPLSTLLAGLKLFLVAIVLALLIKVMLLEAYRIPSGSMQNTLLVGDFLLADKFVYGPVIPLVNIQLPSVREPQIGDVVVFKCPNDLDKSFIKRIVATGGQSVRIVDKDVFVDDHKLEESEYVVYSDSVVIPASVMQPRNNCGPVRVPPGCYFVMGDNRDNSSDSRHWGCVERKLILGKAVMIHWSWQPDPRAPQARITRPLSILRTIAYNISHLPERVRWKRLFKTIE